MRGHRSGVQDSLSQDGGAWDFWLEASYPIHPLYPGFQIFFIRLREEPKGRTEVRREA
jgi:hypothetical protein